jgi:hypothetical protein
VKEKTMRQDHPDLITTLRDVAATAVTLLDTFAQIRRERTAQQPPAAPSPTPQADDDDPTDASAPQADLDDAPKPRPPAADPADPPETAHAIFLTTLRREPEMTRMEAAHRRLVGPIRRTDARESQQWAPARKLADSINDRLFEIAELAHNAIKEDGLRTLPILDALIERLHGEFRDRTGPFAAVPDVELVS